jgi:AmmeMemoRadiSam system protein B
MGSAAGKNTGDRVGSYRRQAYHAGSWYENDSRALHDTLQGYLEQAAADSSSWNINDNIRLRAVICPHAGYRFSGPTAAYSYHALKQALAANQNIQRILVLHPAHHVYLQGCAVSGATELETPLGNLPVADDLRREILALSSAFSVMNSSMDDEEHSGEMQYPYLAKLLLSTTHKAKNIQVLPLMCGALSNEQEAAFGKLLAEIIQRPHVICVISSDFCHWGSRFRYQPTAPQSSRYMPIYQFIQEMDQQGMDLISLQQPGAFAEYLKRTKNTICGRHAISVWLHAVTTSRGGGEEESNLAVNFVKYAQSSAVENMNDSSVSYASAVVTASSNEA